MNFQTESVASTFDAEAAMTSLQGERDAQRSGSIGQALGAMNSYGGGSSLAGAVSEAFGLGGWDRSVVGINVGEIDSMVNAITSYCENIENYLKQLDPAANSLQAFRGEAVQEQLRNYMDTMKTYCMNLVSQLLAFNDKLRDVRNQWNQYTSDVAGNIGSATGQYATGSRYTESIQ